MDQVAASRLVNSLWSYKMIEYPESRYITVLCRAYDDESGRMQRTRRPVTQQLAYGADVGTTPLNSQGYPSADRQYLAVDTMLCNPDKIRTISNQSMRRWRHVVLGQVYTYKYRSNVLPTPKPNIF
jgi:hypothetical protein